MRITQARHDILSAVATITARRGGPCNVREALDLAFGWPMPTRTARNRYANVNTLVAAGYLADATETDRIQHGLDRRSRWLTLTPAGVGQLWRSLGPRQRRRPGRRLGAAALDADS